MSMERELILQARAGNREAFGRLVGMYGRRVYHTAYSFLHNVDDASDIVQEVFLRAYRSLSSFDVSRALFPWLYRITRNLCINRTRRASNRDLALPVDDILPARVADPADLAVRTEEERQIREAIENLPDKYRSAVVLKHFQDCSYAEIAEILDIPIGTVMSRLYTARMKLKACLVETLG